MRWRLIRPLAGLGLLACAVVLAAWPDGGEARVARATVATSSPAEAAKKRCRFVRKRIRGRTRRVRVCRTIRPPPPPPPPTIPRPVGVTVERLFRVNIGAALRASVEPYFALSVGPSGLLYVADTTADRVLVFDANGQSVNRWGSTGTGPGQFRFAAGDATIGGIAVDGTGDVYVADSGNDRIQRFDSSGQFELQWGAPGTENGQFTRVLDTAVDRQGNVHVLEDRGARVQKFTPGGTFLLKFAEGAFEDPGGIEVDSAGNVYVADYRGNVVKKFDAAGNLLATLGSIGRAGGQFDHPSGVGVDAQDNVYVADGRNRRIQKLRGDGTVVGYWYTGSVQTAFVVGVAVDAQGFVYTIDIRGILQKFRIS